jgi:nucleoid-associated protein YgaU
MMAGTHRRKVERRRERAVAVGLSGLGVVVVATCVGLLTVPHGNGTQLTSASEAAERAASAAASAASAIRRTSAPPPSPVAVEIPSTPASPPPAETSAAAETSAVAETPAAATMTPPTDAASLIPGQPVTYTVKAGDSLWSISQWFHLHGYGDIYEANKSAIGKNPSLIKPGQKIVIRAGAITLAP